MEPVIICVSFEQRRKILASVPKDAVLFALDPVGSFVMEPWRHIVFRPLMTPDAIVTRADDDATPVAAVWSPADALPKSSNTRP